MTFSHTALFDQAKAAARDADTLLQRTAEATGATYGHQAPGPYAAKVLADALRRWHTGRLYGCKHIDRSPGVGWLLAWNPRRLWCNQCVVAPLGAVRGAPEDHMCDVCRQPATPINTSMGALGSVILVYGVCDGCAPSEGLPS